MDVFRKGTYLVPLELFLVNSLRMGVFLFIDGPALVCGWVNFPILWPHTPVQTKLKCLPPLGVFEFQTA